MKKIPWMIPVLLLFLMHLPLRAQEEVAVSAGESRSLKVTEEIKKISLGDPRIADVKVLSINEILINGKSEGDTSLIIWTDKGPVTRKIIVSKYNPAVVRQEITSLLAGVRGITVQVKAGKVVLDGEVLDQKDFPVVESVLKKYGDKIMNFIKLPFQMIKINARVVEISENDNTSIGVDWEKKFEFVESSVGGLYKIGQIERSTRLDAVIDFMVREGRAKIVSRPNIIVINGESASFHSGGRILVPVGQGLNNVTVEEKTYGVNLKVLPYGDRKSNLIKTKVQVEVSTVDWANGVKYSEGTLPAFKERTIDTQIDIKLGKTIVIGGMLMEEESFLDKKVPILGYIPLLGYLFSSKEKATYKTELVIFLTPSFVNFMGEEIME